MNGCRSIRLTNFQSLIQSGRDGRKRRKMTGYSWCVVLSLVHLVESAFVDINSIFLNHHGKFFFSEVSLFREKRLTKTTDFLRSKVYFQYIK